MIRYSGVYNPLRLQGFHGNTIVIYYFNLLSVELRRTGVRRMFLPCKGNQTQPHSNG